MTYWKWAFKFQQKKSSPKQPVCRDGLSPKSMFATSQNFPYWGFWALLSHFDTKESWHLKTCGVEKPLCRRVQRLLGLKKTGKFVVSSSCVCLVLLKKKQHQGKVQTNLANKSGSLESKIGTTVHSGSSKQGDTIPSSILMVFTQERWGLSWANC